MQHQIGENAGKIWQFLSQARAVKLVKEIAKGTNLKEADALLAVGWLAKEDKLKFEGDPKGGIAAVKVGLK